MKRHLLLGLALVISLWAAPLSSAKIVNRIIAVVNDHVITEADLGNYVLRVLRNNRLDLSNAESVEINSMALQRMIDERLMLQDAKELGIEIETSELNEQLENLKEKYGTDEAFQESLVVMQLTVPALREQIKNQLLIQRIIYVHVHSTILVSPQEISERLEAHPEMRRPSEAVKLSHILVRVNGKQTEDEAVTLIRTINERLEQEESFAELAEEFSEGPHASEGGKVGWVGRGEWLPELDTILFESEVGQISTPVRTTLGFHLVYIEDRKTIPAPSTQQMAKTIRRNIYNEKFEEAFDRWMDGLREDAYVEIHSSYRNGG